MHLLSCLVLQTGPSAPPPPLPHGIIYGRSLIKTSITLTGCTISAFRSLANFRAFFSSVRLRFAYEK